MRLKDEVALVTGASSGIGRAIATPTNRAVLEDPEAKEEAVSEIPRGRFGRPEVVAAVAAFLASAEGDYVTGSTYYVDGGLTQQVTRY